VPAGGAEGAQSAAGMTSITREGKGGQTTIEAMLQGEGEEEG